jgi:hypothetical protein
MPQHELHQARYAFCPISYKNQKKTPHVIARGGQNSAASVLSLIALSNAPGERIETNAVGLHLEIISMELPIARALKTFEPALGSSDRTFYISRIPNLDRCLGTFELVSIGAKQIFEKRDSVGGHGTPPTNVSTVARWAA